MVFAAVSHLAPWVDVPPLTPLPLVVSLSLPLPALLGAFEGSQALLSGVGELAEGQAEGRGARFTRHEHRRAVESLELGVHLLKDVFREIFFLYIFLRG